MSIKNFVFDAQQDLATNISYISHISNITFVNVKMYEGDIRRICQKNNKSVGKDCIPNKPTVCQSGIKPFPTKTQFLILTSRRDVSKALTFSLNYKSLICQSKGQNLLFKENVSKTQFLLDLSSFFTKSFYILHKKVYKHPD